jgi:hypothetical protein
VRHHPIFVHHEQRPEQITQQQMEYIIGVVPMELLQTVQQQEQQYVEHRMEQPHQVIHDPIFVLLGQQKQMWISQQQMEYIIGIVQTDQV